MSAFSDAFAPIGTAIPAVSGGANTRFALNPFRDPTPWHTVYLGGVLVIGGATGLFFDKLNDVSVEDEWAAQKGTSSNGTTYVFRGTKLTDGIKMTIRAWDEDAFDNLRVIWDLMAPVPGLFGGGGSSASAVPGGTVQIGVSQIGGFGGATVAQGSTVSIGSNGNQVGGFGGATVAQDPAATDTAGADAAPAAQASVGPKPPTLSIVQGTINYVGIGQVARKKWDGPYEDDNGTGNWYVNLEWVPSGPVTPANSTAQSPATPGSPDGNAAPDPQAAADDAELAKAVAASAAV